MPEVEVKIRVGSGEPFPIEIDDEDDVQSLACLVISVRPELGEDDLPRLVHKGKVLKHDQQIKDLGIQAGDFIVAVAPAAKKPSGYTAAPAAAAPEASPVVAPTPAAAPPAAAAPAATPFPAMPADSGASGGSPQETMIAELCNMGFERAKVQEALAAAFGNPDRAVEYLFNGMPAAATQAPPPAGGLPASAGGGNWAEQVFGPQLLTKSGLQSTSQALGGAKVVAIYFSAHWCPPCRAFTPQLAAALSGNRYPQLAVVFVSSDREEAAFQSYYGSMPWLAVPYNATQRQMLGSHYQVQGIPSFIVLNSETGSVISRDGRGDIARNSMNGRMNIEACLQDWGVSAPPPTPAPVVEQPKAPPAKVGPKPLPIDEEAVKDAIGRVMNEPWESEEAFFKTGLKILDNTLQNPEEAKFRQLKCSNAALKGKFLDVAGNAGKDLLGVAGFQKSGDGETEVLALPGAPDGHCTAVRERLQTAATAAWERQAREDRDKRIADLKEQDKHRHARYSGGDENGRHQIGRAKPSGGGG